MERRRLEDPAPAVPEAQLQIQVDRRAQVLVRPGLVQVRRPQAPEAATRNRRRHTRMSEPRTNRLPGFMAFRFRPTAARMQFPDRQRVVRAATFLPTPLSCSAQMAETSLVMRERVTAHCRSRRSLTPF